MELTKKLSFSTEDENYIQQENITDWRNVRGRLKSRIMLKQDEFQILRIKKKIYKKLTNFF